MKAIEDIEGRVALKRRDAYRFYETPRVSLWREALGVASRAIVVAAVDSGYGRRFKRHLAEPQAILEH
jgi:hypothetical protein